MSLNEWIVVCVKCVFFFGDRPPLHTSSQVDIIIVVVNDRNNESSLFKAQLCYRNFSAIFWYKWCSFLGQRFGMDKFCCVNDFLSSLPRWLLTLHVFNGPELWWNFGLSQIMNNCVHNNFFVGRCTICVITVPTFSIKCKWALSFMLYAFRIFMTKDKLGLSQIW